MLVRTIGFTYKYVLSYQRDVGKIKLLNKEINKTLINEETNHNEQKH
jgi:hypothetical protein